jgi:hypothetical protein
MFGAGSFTEVYSSVAWNDFVFRSWYAFEALLNAAWIGLGTVYLLSRPRFAKSSPIVLGVLSIIGLYGVMALPIDSTGFVTTLPLSDQYRQILPNGAWVRGMTPLFNIFGLIALAGGAIYSAYLFWRKKTLINRIWRNILIASGALVIAFAITFTRFREGDYLYCGRVGIGRVHVQRVHGCHAPRGGTNNDAKSDVGCRCTGWRRRVSRKQATARITVRALEETKERE